MWWSTKQVKMLCPTRFVVETTQNRKGGGVAAEVRSSQTGLWTKSKDNILLLFHFFLTLTHRCNAVRGHRTCSNNSGVEDYLRRKTNKNRRKYTQLKQIVYLRQKIKRWDRMRYISNAKRAETFIFLSANASGFLALVCRTCRIQYDGRSLHCYCITMWYLCVVVLWPQSLFVSLWEEESARTLGVLDTGCVECQRVERPV